MGKIIIYDLETSRSIVEGYGNRWDFRVVKITRPSELMCFSWKELGSKKVNFVSRYDFKNYHEFVKSLRDLLDSSDITIAHNGHKFDDKMSNRFFILEGITPPSPRKKVDTLREAKRWFKFESNKLDDLGEFLGVGRKESIGYSNLEDDFMSGHPKSKTISLMKKYNNQDVNLLEKVYEKLLPFMSSHPNLGDINSEDYICPKCGSHNIQKRGYTLKRSGKYQRYQCMDCGGWCSQSSIKSSGRTVNA